jgi:hypothetical protein
MQGKDNSEGLEKPVRKREGKTVTKQGGGRGCRGVPSTANWVEFVPYPLAKPHQTCYQESAIMSNLLR